MKPSSWSWLLGSSQNLQMRTLAGALKASGFRVRVRSSLKAALGSDRGQPPSAPANAARNGRTPGPGRNGCERFRDVRGFGLCGVWHWRFQRHYLPAEPSTVSWIHLLTCVLPAVRNKALVDTFSASRSCCNSVHCGCTFVLLRLCRGTEFGLLPQLNFRMSEVVAASPEHVL